MRITNILLAVAILSLNTPIFANSDNKINLAIIADKSSELDKSPLVSLLEVELSKIENINLLERNEIEKILNEKKLQLSFDISEYENRMQIGSILGADILIIIQKNKNSQNQDFQIRIIETRTGIILGNITYTVLNITDNIQSLVANIKSFINKTSVPIENRQYIGILGIENEEPGSRLDSLASTVTALLYSHLIHSPYIVVLEREELRNIIEERDLTGLELDLYGSTILLRGGIRRNKGEDNLLITLSFTSIGNEQANVVTLEVSNSNPGTVNTKILNAVNESLNVKDNLQKSISHEIEANIFAIRAKELMDFDIDQAIGFAEAALSLYPSIEHRDILYECCQLKWEDSSFSLIERLNTCKRAIEVDLENLNEYINSNKKLRPKMMFRIVGMNMGFKANPDQKEEQRIISEIKAMCLEKYKILHNLYKNDNGKMATLLSRKMDNILWLSESIDMFCEEIKSLVTEFENNQEKFIRMDNSNINTVFYERMSRYFNPDFHLEYKKQMHPTIQWISNHDNPLISVIGYYGLLYQDGPEGLDAAIKLLDTMFFKINNDLSSMYIASKAIERLKQDGIMEEYFTNILAKAEKESDSHFLVNNYDAISYFLRYADNNIRIEWSERILSLTKPYQPKSRSKSYEEHRNILVSYASPETKSSNNDIGLWNNYDIRSIPIIVRDFNLHNRLIWVQVDQSSKEIVLVWRSARRKLEDGVAWFDIIFTRMNIEGEKMYQVGILEESNGLSITCSTESPEFIFLGSRRNGLIVVGQKNIEVLDESKGCPSNTIKTMAWLGDYLYLGFDNCLAKYDPKNKNFEIIASSKSVEKKNPLDGGKYYEFKSMITDPCHEDLWFSINDYEFERIGLWKYSPDSNHFSYINKDITTSNMILNDNGDIIFNHIRAYIINTDTDQISLLQNYHEDAVSWSSHKHYVIIGNHIIFSGGRLFSNDGSQYKLGQYWEMLDRFGPGFIAAAYHDNNAELWYIEPKNQVQQ